MTWPDDERALSCLPVRTVLGFTQQSVLRRLLRAAFYLKVRANLVIAGRGLS